METFSQRAAEFNHHLTKGLSVPRSIEVLNPYQDPTALKYSSLFLKKYFSDYNKRTFILGINPGRLGAGITGISFTDPVNLMESCGISNSLDDRPELSSQFVYEVIAAYGGVTHFYSHFFLSSVCPLGFTRDGKNINYYDDKELLKATKEYIVSTMNMQIEMGAKRHSCICLGEGANFKYLSKLNDEHQWFTNIYPLAHPRYILQYKRKEKQRYIGMYLDTLNQCAKQR